MTQDSGEQQRPVPIQPFQGARRAAAYNAAPRLAPAPSPASADEPMTGPAGPPPITPSSPQPSYAGAGHVPRESGHELPEDDLAALSRGVAGPVGQPQPSGLSKVLAAVGIKRGPSAAQIAAQEAQARLDADVALIRQTTFTRAVGVLVANRKGSSAKTPTALGLGGTIANIRGGSTVVIEVPDDPGTLAFRAEGSPSRGLGELVRDVHQVTTIGQLNGYTAPQTSYASVIGTVGRRAPLTGEAVRDVVQLVDTYYGVRVLDSGNQLTSGAFLAAVEVSDVLVIPMLNGGDSVLEAIETLETVRDSGPRGAMLAEHAIMLRSRDGRPEHPRVLERIDRLIERARPREVFDIPYDEHIAERGEITYERLAPATRAAFVAATAGIYRALRSTVN